MILLSHEKALLHRRRESAHVQISAEMHYAFFWYRDRKGSTA